MVGGERSGVGQSRKGGHGERRKFRKGVGGRGVARLRSAAHLASVQKVHWGVSGVIQSKKKNTMQQLRRQQQQRQPAALGQQQRRAGATAAATGDGCGGSGSSSSGNVTQ